jgi:hypothetical protein
MVKLLELEQRLKARAVGLELIESSLSEITMCSTSYSKPLPNSLYLLYSEMCRICV